MVEAREMKQTVNHQSPELIIKRDTVIFRLGQGTGNTYHYVAQKKGFAAEIISCHRKGEYVGSLVNPSISGVQTLHPVIVYK